MKLSNNKVQTVLAHYRSELGNLYEPGELDGIIALVFSAVSGFSKIDLSLKRDSGLSESELLHYLRVAKELKKGRPVQYVLGKAWFMDMPLEVNESVLIPRPETEEMTLLLLGDLKKAGKDTAMILDMCTGSGCIAVGIKSKMPGAGVFGTDISPEALAVARRNAQEFAPQTEFFEDDALHPATAKALQKWDAIISNPPYVLKTEEASIHPRVKEHEPHLALFVEDHDPLVFYRAIAGFAHRQLNTGGLLYFEVNTALGEETQKVVQEAGFGTVLLLHDIFDRPRFVRAVKE